MFLYRLKKKSHKNKQTKYKTKSFETLLSTYLNFEMLSLFDL